MLGHGGDARFRNMTEVCTVSGIRFCITHWAAWAPGLDTPEAWQAWARAPFLPLGEAAPDLARIPAMQRRRIDRLGRCAIEVADACRQPQDRDAPLVFVSRHGDLARSLALLRDLIQDQPMSPTQFGLSVHNAVAAQYSMLHGERGNYTALAAGKAGIEAGLIESAALLGAGARSVMLVACDDRIPQAYWRYHDEPLSLFGFALRLVASDAAEAAAATATGLRFSLHWQACPDQTADQSLNQAPNQAPDQADAGTRLLPHALDALRFLIGQDSDWQHQAEGRLWQWQRHV